jgi:hypothetical protein
VEEMKIKKYVISIAFSTILIVTLLFLFTTQSKLDGSTVESRELRLNQLNKINGNAHICSEIKIDDYIVSGYISSNNKYGLAIFEPTGNGKYRFQSNYLREHDELIHRNIIVNQKNYDLFWANKANLDYAEITYTISNKAQKTLKLDATENKIIYNKSPSNSYSVEYVFVDAEGNRFK